MQLDPHASQAMLSLAAQPMRSRAWMPLLSELLALGNGQAELVSHAERPWASVTFSGSRHTVRMTFTGRDAVNTGERFIDALPEHEFAIPRQLVADAAIRSVVHTALPEPRLEVTVELLLLDEG
ncbi:hypothetical protein B0I00_0251 [Novosphingobium kunmingense]|uniref:Uncharacterized protein n=1 Tax=Novosphingobium kunmingense TaxID=1211806 RepID=A0A2N0I1M3_9SPHN|nr:hypothetical protein [Novosphingobium kunmingense]PKB25070.1 hypothetical protein B0I00_0251 [Novosphingobium kunmingense]